jgi:hypothetical protein
MKEGLTTSPYFKLASSPSGPFKPCSAYFLRSPSSVHGSIESLGPLIYTWTTSSRSHSDVISSCTRTSATSSSTIICDACQMVLSEALARFSHCPEFQPPLDDNKKLATTALLVIPRGSKEPQQKSACCVEEIGFLAEHQLRHLCRHGCYLKAFAPSRDWVTLRQTIHRRTDQSMGAY